MITWFRYLTGHHKSCSFIGIGASYFFPGILTSLLHFIIRLGFFGHEDFSVHVGYLQYLVQAAPQTQSSKLEKNGFGLSSVSVLV